MTDAALPRPLIRLPAGLKHAGLVVGLLIVGIVVLAGVAGPSIISDDPFAQNLTNRLVPPVWMEGGTSDHLLGTDQLGRDYLARLVYGARISLLIGVSTVLLSGMIGITLGVVGGFFGGRVDDVVTFIITSRLALPLDSGCARGGVAGGKLAHGGRDRRSGCCCGTGSRWSHVRPRCRCAVSTMWPRRAPPGARRPTSCWSRFCRTSSTRWSWSRRSRSRSRSCSRPRCRFSGSGCRPPLPSWGLMIAEGRDYMFFQAWVIVIPGAGADGFVLGINLLGDGLRDVLAPENRAVTPLLTVEALRGRHSRSTTGLLKAGTRRPISDSAG